MKKFLITRISSEPFRQGGNELGGEAVGADLNGIRVALGAVPADETPALLASQLRTARVETAPAHGLCLWKIHYGAIPGLPKPGRS